MRQLVIPHGLDWGNTQACDVFSRLGEQGPKFPTALAPAVPPAAVLSPAPPRPLALAACGTSSPSTSLWATEHHATRRRLCNPRRDPQYINDDVGNELREAPSPYFPPATGKADGGLAGPRRFD